MRPALTRRLIAFIVALGLLASLAAATPVLAVSIVVNTTADNTTDDDLCSLREAITTANTDAPVAVGGAGNGCATGSGPDTIPSGSTGRITLTSALPDVPADLSISGAGTITISGNNAVRVLNITGGTVNLSGLTITGGLAAEGGGIRSTGNLAVSNTTISGNAATGGNLSGGGIWNNGTLTITNSTISGNTANGIPFGSGGGIMNVLPGTLTITNSTISGNTGRGPGGLHNLLGTVVAVNITVSGNSAVQGGGGIGACGTETIVNSIVAGNTAAVGPDIDCFADTITTSVIGVPSGMTLADILVPGGPANYGGPTQTIALALVVGNPAIDSATGAVCVAAPVNGLDQRGLPRPAACDIGAYEAQPPSVAAQPNVSATATSAAGAVVNYTAPAGTDEQGGTAAVACLPASGSTFAVGSTTVTCTATDAVGHTGSGTFSVNVAVPAGSPTATASPTPTPTATPGLLPNTASRSGTSVPSGLSAALALIGLLSVVAIGRRAWSWREARLRS